MLGNNPELYAFFNKSHQPSSKPGNAGVQLSQPAAFGQAMIKPAKTQNQVLAKAVVAAVENLQNLDAIASAPRRICNRHCALGIRPEHHELVHDNFLTATAEVLGDAVTPEVADARSGALLHISGYFEAEETALYAASTAEQTDWNTQEAAPFIVDKVDHTASTMRSLYLKRADGAADG